ncbi:hypothetical protein FE257_010752 [Aspergillus nanangensis]|uniref:Zn(2)-C6 fungal-type domain-containing protein n=1 Tax=Aspergillus nanangensis TaxID=2582783 RepID=A0AAD4GY64_ASPNN|nr:hypothetical protein FE257_010752 [Aspergillus nanangensis]
MPRPKVRPEDRQRSSRACKTCKALKIRCDSQNPCTTCIRREQPDECIYIGTDRRRRRQGVLPRHGHGQVESASSHDDTPFQLDSLFSGVVTPESRSDGHHVPAQTPLLECEPVEQGWDRSSKVYVGETSALSFLHFLRKTVTGYVGSVSFTDCERYHTVLEVQPCVQDNVNVDERSDKTQMWIDSYHEATGGILDLFTAHEMETLLVPRFDPQITTYHPTAGHEDAAAMDVVLAIGAQASGSEEDSRLASGYFCRARRMAFDDMLMGQTLSTVRLFLLMSFYMLGACDRNAASMFLGVAARAAIVLDLHNPESYRGLPPEVHDNRSRIWESTRNLDCLSSFVLSRPKSLPVVRTPTNPTPGVNIQSTFRAISEGCALLDMIVDTLSKEKILHVPTAESLLAQLRQWNRALPLSLRQFHSPAHEGGTAPLEPIERRWLMGSIHVSCVYYFAVILVTRPYLIAYLTSRLRGKAPDHLISDPDEASDVNIKNSKVSKLGQVCVSAALYIADMCKRAKVAGLTFGNLCLLKAWIFGAGLVLGFSMFAGEPRRDIETLFDSTLDVLDDIGRTSPQARLYHQILQSFADAVTRYRHRVAGEVRRTVQHYIDQILIVDTSPGDRAATGARLAGQERCDDEWLAGAITGIEANGVAFDPLSDGTKGAQTLLQMAGFADQPGWDEMNVSWPEDLFPDIEPFDQLFYTVE